MRLIDADAAEKLFKEQYCNYCNSYNGAKCRACEVRDGVDVYNDMPTIDPVKHGWWFEECCVGDEYYRCSACGMPFVLTDGTPASNEFHYCPNCGAKMDEVSE